MSIHAGFQDRKYQFVAGVGTLELLATTFALGFSAEPREDAPSLGRLSLRHVCEYGSRYGLAYREAFEARVKLIEWTYKGETGTLNINRAANAGWTGTGAQSFADVKLVGFNPRVEENNSLLLYDLEFKKYVGGRTARTLIFTGGGSKTVNAENLVVDRRPLKSKAVFKEVFRGGDILIPGGPSRSVLLATAMRAPISGASDLARRQAVEAEYKAWTDRIDTTGTLTIDGSALGTWLLEDVQANDLSQFDAAYYTLRFIGNYIAA